MVKDKNHVEISVKEEIKVALFSLIEKICTVCPVNCSYKMTLMHMC